MRLSCLGFLWGVATGCIVLGASPVSPLTPDQERASFRFADTNLVIELAASEPEVTSPVAMAWDSSGHLFVAEMNDYPTGPRAGRIRMLEDLDHDGHYEKATVFVDKLSFPNGVLPWNGGLLVTAAPDILFFKDLDGDGRADEARVILTGFTEGNQQLRVNGLMWGLDGWIYGANGRSDGEVHRPGDTKTVSLRGHDFRFRPETGEFEAIAGRSEFGLAQDDWGHRFLSWNTIPIRDEVIPERFLLRNPRLSSAEALHSLLPENDDGRVFPLAPTPQTFNDESTSHFNALAGLSIYRGGALPPQYYGNAFMGEALLGLVHRRVLEPDGPSYLALRPEKNKEFLASTDSWFHPVNFANGPDGALYIVDFYRQWVEHPEFVHQKLKEEPKWQTGADHGRIWRVRPRVAIPQNRLTEDLNQVPVQRLPKYFEHVDGWWRDTALRLWRERATIDYTPAPRILLFHSHNPIARVLSLYAMRDFGRLDGQAILHALQDQNPRVREAGVRLAEGTLDKSDAILAAVTNMADDPDARVRLNIALIIAEAEQQTRSHALARIATRPDLDHLTMTAVRSSMGDRPWLTLAETLQIQLGGPPTTSPALLEFIRETAFDVGSSKNPQDQRALLDEFTDSAKRGFREEHLAIFAGFAHGLEASQSEFLSQLQQWRSLSAQLFGQLIQFASRTAGNKTINSLSRQAAASTLALTHEEEASRFLLALLLPPNPSEVQSSAAEGLLSAADPSQIGRAFASWEQYQIATRRKLLSNAIRFRSTTITLLDALEKGRVAPVELDASTRQKLLELDDPSLKTRAQAVLGSPTSADRNAVIKTFAPALELNGDARKGALIFSKTCLQCHAVEGQGQQVGPDLSGIGAHGKASILTDILDPSRNVEPDFVSYSVISPSGDSVSGLIVTESPSRLTLRRPGAADEIIPRAQIKEVRGSGKSLMPDGLEAGLSSQDFADLLEFVAHPSRRLLPR